MKSNGNENKINDVFSDIEYKGTTYKLAFNINVMENLQEKYGSFNNLSSFNSNSSCNSCNISCEEKQIL